MRKQFQFHGSKGAYTEVHDVGVLAKDDHRTLYQLEHFDEQILETTFEEGATYHEFFPNLLSLLGEFATYYDHVAEWESSEDEDFLRQAARNGLEIDPLLNALGLGE